MVNNGLHKLLRKIWNYKSYTNFKYRPICTRGCFVCSYRIPNAVREDGGCSKLVGGYVFDKSDGSDDITFVFTEGNTALGTINATANVSDADLLANNICGITKVDNDQASSNAWIDNSKIHQMLPGSSVSENTQDLLLLQAASGSKSVFIQGILVSGTTPTFADGDLQIILHIEK